jgi:hypothetical protein
MKGTQKSSNQLDSINFTSSAWPSPRRATWSTKTAAIFNETNNDSDRHMPAEEEEEEEEKEEQEKRRRRSRRSER